MNSVGKYESCGFYTHGEFQDYTDYAKYSYSSVDFTDNKYFQQVTADNKVSILKYIENFERWIETIKSHDSNDELVICYDFDISIISSGDYYYIDDDSRYTEFENYDIYFFDSETNMLYYFHNNI